MAINNDQRRDQQQGHTDDQPGAQRQQSQDNDARRQKDEADNFAKDPKRAAEPGKKSGAQTEQKRHQDHSAGKQQS